MSSLMYGNLRPLPLPMPDEPLLPGPPEEMATIVSLALHPRRELLKPPSDTNEHAFYRWILGHHISSGIWRLLINLFERMLDEGASEDLLNRAGEWYDRYSATQIYTGSCTPSTYTAAIRSRMIANNSAFSGKWARDHERALSLLKALNTPGDGVLAQALKRHRTIHMRLAKILVPDGGKSLLEQSGRNAKDPVTDWERDQFDGFFMIERGPVHTAQFQADMLRNTAAARCDLLAHPIESTELRILQDLLPADVSTLLRDIAIDVLELET